MRQKEEEVFLAKHEDLLNREPQKEAARMYDRSVAFFRSLSMPLRIVLALAVGIFLVVVIPFTVYAARETWNDPPHRTRLLHGSAVFLIGVTSFVVVFRLLNV